MNAKLAAVLKEQRALNVLQRRTQHERRVMSARLVCLENEFWELESRARGLREQRLCLITPGETGVDFARREFRLSPRIAAELRTLAHEQLRVREALQSARAQVRMFCRREEVLDQRQRYLRRKLRAARDIIERRELQDLQICQKIIEHRAQKKQRSVQYQ